VVTGNICTFASQIVGLCLYLEPLENYKASKLKMPKEYAKMQHIFL